MREEPPCVNLPADDFSNPLKGCHCWTCTHLREQGKPDVEIRTLIPPVGFVPAPPRKEQTS
jgi:hypothetical protein